MFAYSFSGLQKWRKWLIAKSIGLGLSIAKDLVELNNGRIWVESTEHVGSKFFVELPKA